MDNKISFYQAMEMVSYYDTAKFLREVWRPNRIAPKTESIPYDETDGWIEFKHVKGFVNRHLSPAL